MKTTNEVCLNSVCAHWTADSYGCAVANHCKIYRDVTLCLEVKLPATVGDKAIPAKVNCCCTDIAKAVQPEPPKPKVDFEEATFQSPQTGSKYTIVNSSKILFVSYRKIGYGDNRVRVQGPADLLKQVNAKLGWGGIKDDDHISKVTGNASLDATIAKALAAVKEVIGNN